MKAKHDLKTRLMSINNNAEKREFKRFLIEFVLEIAAKDAHGREFVDKTISRNISGGGAKFLTHKADKYFQDQILEMIFIMPGTGDVNAHMKAKGRVIRVETSSDQFNSEKNYSACVAIVFETLLNFERVYRKK
jgi:hypothetical protein